MTGEAPWTLPLVALAAGLAAGAWAAAVAWRRERRSPPAEATLKAMALADLEERAHACVAQLRDLEEQREELDAEHYETQRVLCERRAAEALRQRDALRQRGVTKTSTAAEPVDAVSPVAAFLAAHPQLRGALWGGGGVAVVAVAYGLIAAEPSVPTPQPSAAPAAGRMQSTPSSAPSATGADRARNPHDEQTAALYERVEQHPDDVDALVLLAHRLLSSMVLDEARRMNDRALALQPQNVEARVHDAVLRAAAGEPHAEVTLDELLEAHPTVAEGWFFRGMLSMQRGDTEGMRSSFEKYVAHAPDGPRKERIRALLSSGGPSRAP